MYFSILIMYIPTCWPNFVWLYVCFDILLNFTYFYVNYKEITDNITIIDGSKLIYCACPFATIDCSFNTRREFINNFFSNVVSSTSLNYFHQIDYDEFVILIYDIQLDFYNIIHDENMLIFVVSIETNLLTHLNIVQYLLLIFLEFLMLVCVYIIMCDILLQLSVVMLIMKTDNIPIIVRLDFLWDDVMMEYQNWLERRLIEYHCWTIMC